MTSPGVLLAGRYRLQSLIAAGGVGEVWRAEDLVLGRMVAVKLLQDSYSEHPETLARFRAEARHAGSLSHPGIAHVYDYGEADPPGPPYLVLELVDGPSLAQVLARGPVSPTDAMDVLAQAAAGLAAAHATGLVHRDIKPANLLISPDGTVKITDFGIAHAAGSAPITRVGMLVGTPAYLAPERVLGALATPASDLYSLGIVAYECLAGTPPFRGTAQEITAASQHHPLPPLPPSVPPEIATLVAELTARDPAARPAGAGDVAIRAGRLRDAGSWAATASPAVPLAAGPEALPPTRAYAPGTAYAPGPLAGQSGIPAGEPRTMAGEAGIPASAWGAPAGDAVTLAGDWAPAAEVPWPDRSAARGRRQRRGAGRGRLVGLAVAAAGVVALAVWLVAGLSGATSSQAHSSASGPAMPKASAPAVRLVAVHSDALAGQPAGAVLRRLRRLGLRPQTVPATTDQQSPGTVISVQPAGQVPAGSIVTVTVAVQSHHHHGDGGGGGDGGNGNGN
jgi:eukaryotic-like serine/threonine-protein kinase